MYWLLGVLGILGLLIVRRSLPSRRRVCKFVFAAQRALERRDFQSFDENLKRARQIAEKLSDDALRLQFRSDLTLMGVQGAYWRGDLDSAEQLGRRAIEILAPIGDNNGRVASAHQALGDILLDNGKPAQAAEEFRAAAKLAEQSKVPAASIFPLQRLADALLEEEKREDAAAVIEHCVEIENKFILPPAQKRGATLISMTAPDLSFVRGDFATAECLFEEKVRHFEGSPANSSGIDFTRYQLHLAEAQQALGEFEKARATLMSACTITEKRFGQQHPRVTKLRKKLKELPEAPVPVSGK